MSQAMLSALQSIDDAIDGFPSTLPPFLSGFTTIPVISMVGGSSLVPNVMPTALPTVGFPQPAHHGMKPTRKRRRSPQQVPSDACAICLEDLHEKPLHACVPRRRMRASTQTLPCLHGYHPACLWAVLNNPGLGANSMMKCPLCRGPVDRHDLARSGYDVSPSRLDRMSPTTLRAPDASQVSRACVAFRALLQHQRLQPPQLVRYLVDSRSLTAADGFLYNTCLLSLDRMLFHKRNFVKMLQSQLAIMQHREHMLMDFIDSTLACHVDVLIHTPNNHQDDL